ncbi:MAG: TonB-dependent receptor [Prevotella sp.]|nr:TonB-dependent receptor [Prevotella sp.]MDY5259002.1 TonB-dependent receptor [Prevotella sp.]
MKRIMLTCAAGLAFASFAEAGPISGIVKDKKTGEPLIGSVVQVKGSNTQMTTTGLDGTFSLKDLPDNGRVTLVITYMSYKTKEVTVDMSTPSQLTIDMEEDAKQLGEVVVTGFKSNRTDRSAVAMVKNSDNMLNVMSQQAIQLSPDVNVASVLQRVSGVTMESSASGEATYAILRGMDKRYNYTLVNGMKIPSPDDKNRYIPMNLFPSDLMDRLVVSKTLNADMEGDAAGGVIDMNMKDAPGQFQLQANAAVGMSDFFWSGNHDYLSAKRGDATSKAPYEQYGSQYDATMQDFKNGPARISSHALPMPNFIGGFSVGNRFWAKRLGIIVAGSVQNQYKGTERTLNKPVMANGEQTEYISSMKKRYYSIHELTSGLHAKVDLNLGNHKIEWYNMLINNVEDNTRYNQSIITDYGYEPDKGNYTRDDEMRSMRQTQTIFASHLKGTHHLGTHFVIDWAGLFADAREKDPDRAYIGIKNTFEDNQRKNTVPNSMERRFQHNDDKDWTGQINVTYNTAFSGLDFMLKGGAMYRNKKRNNRFYSYLFNPEHGQTLDDDSYAQYDNISWYCRTPRAQASQLNYDSKEHIGAVYLMTKLATSWGELIGGLRAEHTNQIYTMLQRFQTTGSLGEQSYWDWLPSVAMKWMVNKKMNIRLSYYKSINRPGFYELVPYQIEGEEYTEKGNPTLRRARIDNADLRWEWFPSATEQVLLGVFYKYLKDPIETTFESDQRQTNNSYYMPQNLGNARNMGLELDVIKYIRHFGVKANYTYTHSSITTKKELYTAKNVITMVDQTRPLVNQAAHTANLSLLYKDTQHGWNAQLAGSYIGPKLVVVSPFKDADEWERGVFSLDLSGEKKFRNGLSIFLKANNLLNNERQRYLKTVNSFNLNLPGQEDGKTITSTYKYGRTFLIGVRYTL